MYSRSTLISTQSSKEANFVRAWSINSLPGKRDFRLNVLVTENGTVCSAEELVQALMDGLKVEENPNSS